MLSGESTVATINDGRIGLEKLPALTRLVDYKSIDEIFTCGLTKMLTAVKEFLKTMGIDPPKIHT